MGGRGAAGKRTPDARQNTSPVPHSCDRDLLLRPRPLSYPAGNSGIPIGADDAEDECADLAQCNCACFCRGKCLRSQGIPHELALFSRSQGDLQGAQHGARDIA